ncbi:MAG: hypothetical protein ACE5I3_16045, partial [Phycisphaerae bacterium]
MSRTRVRRRAHRDERGLAWNPSVRNDMRLVDRLYDWLSQGPTPDCDRIFAAALPHAEPAWSERIVRILLKRGQEASWAALIGRYDQLAPEI